MKITTLRQAARHAKRNLQSESVTTIHKDELSTYDIELAHVIAEMINGQCREEKQGNKVYYVVTKPKQKRLWSKAQVNVRK